MQHLEVSGAVRPLKWSLGVEWLNIPFLLNFCHRWPDAAVRAPECTNLSTRLSCTPNFLLYAG